MLKVASFCWPRLTTSKVFCHAVKITFYIRHDCHNTWPRRNNTHAMFEVVTRPLI